MLRTPDDIIAAIRARKDALGLSHETVEELVGLCAGHLDKIIGPSCLRTPSIFMLMSILSALGLAIAFVVDPEAKVRTHVELRAERYVRKHKIMTLTRARGIVLSRQGRRAARAKWAATTPEQRQAHIAMMNDKRASLRLARKSEST